MIRRAYAVPHPPIILPEVGRGEEEAIAKTAAAFERMAREIAQLKPDTLVIASPHAPLFADGFFVLGGDREAGDLKSFGVSGVREEAAIDRAFSDALREAMLRRAMSASVMTLGRRGLDHGSLIPLRFIHARYREFRLVLIGLSLLPASAHREMGRAVAQVSEKLGRRTVFIASGDLSHVLKEDGPYGFKPEGPRFDSEMARIFNEGDLEALFSIDPHLVDQAAECGLRSFQIMTGALDGRPFEAELFSYEGTFGVGYALASFTPY